MALVPSCSAIFSASILKYMSSSTLQLDPRTHITFSFPGKTAEELFERVKCVDHAFDVAVVQVGANDCSQGHGGHPGPVLTPKDVFIRIKTLVMYLIMVKRSRVILYTILPRDDIDEANQKAKLVNKMLKKTFRRSGLPVQVFATETVVGQPPHPTMLCKDDLHLSNFGNRVFADILCQQLSGDFYRSSPRVAFVRRKCQGCGAEGHDNLACENIWKPHLARQVQFEMVDFTA